MLIYIVRTNYLDSGILGCYCSLIGARNAITRFIDATNDLTPSENHNYTYYTSDGYRDYYFEITFGALED